MQESWNPFGAETRFQSGEPFDVPGLDRLHGWWLSHQHVPSGLGADVPSSGMVVDPTRAIAHVVDESMLPEKSEFEQRQVKEAMAEWRLRDGRDPDCAEFDRLRTPTHVIVEHELTEVLHRRVVIVEALTMAELSHPRLLEVMSRCNEFRVAYVYKENAAVSTHSHGNFTSLWEGMVILFLRSVLDAAESAKYLQTIREDLEIRILQANENIGHLIDSWKDALKSTMRRLTDDILLVYHVTPYITKEKLHEVFPDALDIVVPREKVPGPNDVSSVRGYAYLTFGSRSRMLSALKQYSSQPIYISGHQMRVTQYQPPRDIPLGFLRLRRRLRALDLIRELRRAESVTERFERGIQDQIKSHLNGWISLVEKDSVIRKSMNLPVLSLDELYMLFDMPQPMSAPGDKSMDRDDIDELLAASTFEQKRLKEIKSVHLASKSSFRRHDNQKQAAWRREAMRQREAMSAERPISDDYPPWQDDRMGSEDDYSRPPLGKRTPPSSVRSGFPFRRRNAIFRSNASRRSVRRD